MGPPKIYLCAGCFVFNTECTSGTVTGYCTACNTRATEMNKDAARSPKTKKDADAALPDQGFFNAAMMAVFLRYLETNPDWNLASYIDSVEVISSANPTKLMHLGGNNQPWDSNSFMDLLDRLVMEASDSEIKAKSPTTAMIKDGLLLWKYLSFLVAERDMCNGDYALNLGLRFKITDLVLFRIDGLMSMVFKSIELFRTDKTGSQDLLAITGLLRIKLHDIHKGLVDGSLTPLWDEFEFKEILKERIQATYNELNKLLHLHSLCCNREWRGPVDGDLDNVFANMRLSTTKLSFKRATYYVEERDIWTPTTSLSMASGPSTGNAPVALIDNQFGSLSLETTASQMHYSDVVHQNDFNRHAVSQYPVVVQQDSFDTNTAPPQYSDVIHQNGFNQHALSQYRNTVRQNSFNQDAVQQSSAVDLTQHTLFDYIGSQFNTPPSNDLWPITNQYGHTRNDQVWNPDYAYTLPYGLSWGLQNPQGVDRSQYVPITSVYGTAVAQTDPIRYLFEEGNEEWMEDSYFFG